MKRTVGSYFLSAMMLFLSNLPCNISVWAQTPLETTVVDSQWKGKRVAIFGDSISDPRRIGTAKCWWEVLAETLGFTPYPYAVNGHQWTGVMQQAEKLKAERGDNIDAILIFAGTNDYNAGVPIGNWYVTGGIDVQASGGELEFRSQRKLVYSDATFCGRINKVMDYLKTNFPTQQIILLTPIHRGYARFSDNNIQPDESIDNKIRIFVDDYIQTIQEAGSVWATPVIDLYSISGLYPLNAAHVRYFANAETDMLHPNTEGHYRMSKAIQYQLMMYPASF